jgi:holliday junction DNA helicase RuvA
MIGWLSGELKDANSNPILLSVNGVGYEVELPLSYWEGLNSFMLKNNNKDNLELYIHTHIREDAHTLFGFFSEDQKHLFRELIRVNGVGAKSALMILSTFDVSEFIKIIQANDAKTLTQVPGIGKKSAERLLIECQDRVLKANYNSNIDISNNLNKDNNNESKDNKHKTITESVEALIALGYKPQDARAYVKKAYKDSMSTESLIKAVLQTQRCASI